MRALFRRLIISPSSHIDLALAWLLTIVVHTLVPPRHLLAEGDLIPWATMCMTAVALLRGGDLGDSAHPSLTPRQWLPARYAHRLGLVMTPAALAVTFYAADHASNGPWHDVRQEVYAAMGLVAASLVLVALGRADGRTAWLAPGGWPRVRQLTRVALALALAISLGIVHGLDQVSDAVFWSSVAGLLGLQFLALGMLGERPETHEQRRRAGRRDGKPHRPGVFRYLLAGLGPSLGLWLLFLLHTLLDIPVTFTQSTVVSLHVFVWAAVIWAPQVPIAVSCLLHEVVPAGGKDPQADGRATAFDRPPHGALQLDPLGVQRLRVLHHWIVPVRDPRIEEFDDPVRLLWAREGLPLPYHVLGEAAFEPDAGQMPQWHTITIRVDEQRDVGRLEQGNVQTRRLSVLRAFPTRSSRQERAMRTYRWDRPISADKLQVVDATTERISLQDGDIIVLSTEGVARAYEVEIGAPIYPHAEWGRQRVPQLEDYASVS